MLFSRAPLEALEVDPDLGTGTTVKAAFKLLLQGSESMRERRTPDNHIAHIVIAMKCYMNDI